MREASSRVLMEELWAEGVHIQAYDPVASEEAFRLYGDRPDLNPVRKHLRRASRR